VTSIPIVDRVFDQYASVLGRDFIAYRNHVHRVVNLCLAVTGASRNDLDKIAVAAAFHDLGIWTDHTFDYIAPSISLAREHLAARSRAAWIPEIEAMIANHHKITPARARPDRLVEGKGFDALTGSTCRVESVDSVSRVRTSDHCLPPGPARVFIGASSSSPPRGSPGIRWRRSPWSNCDNGHELHPSGELPQRTNRVRPFGAPL
jgi:hypothetical protein